jgi:hypothetical protein
MQMCVLQVLFGHPDEAQVPQVLQGPQDSESVLRQARTRAYR